MRTHCARLMAFVGVSMSLFAVSGCLKASTAPEATTLQVENATTESIAVLPFEVGVYNRSLFSSAEPGLLRNSIARDGIIGPGKAREFSLATIPGYESGASLRVVVQRVRNDSTFLGQVLELSNENLRDSGFSVRVSLR